jgi:hypothetical protein
MTNEKCDCGYEDCPRQFRPELPCPYKTAEAMVKMTCKCCGEKIEPTHFHKVSKRGGGATFCQPCIIEMTFTESVQEERDGRRVSEDRIILPYDLGRY